MTQGQTLCSSFDCKVYNLSLLMDGTMESNEWQSLVETTYEVAYRQFASGRPFDLEGLRSF